MKILVTIISLLLLCSISGVVYFWFFNSPDKSTSIYSRADSTTIDWDLLRTLNVTEPNLPKKVQQLNGMQIKIPGFIIPLEDSQDLVREFLFVPSPMSCIHVPPPPPNQIIHVKMTAGKVAKMSYGPVWLFGKLNIIEKKDKEVRNSYEMDGLATEPYRE